MIHKYSKNKFSLIELLAVLIITSIIIGIALPSMNTMMRGKSVDQATRTLGSTFKALRSYAITHRQYVALIIPADIESLEKPPFEYLNKSYRPCVVTNSNGIFTFDYWISNEKWEFLPTGTAILDIDNTSKYDHGYFSSANEILSVNYSDIDSSKPSCDAKGIVFKSTGKTVGETKFIVVGNSNILLDTTSVKDNQIDIVIDEFTGRISYDSD